MTPTDRQATFGTWQLPGRKPVILYSHALLADLAAAARELGASPFGGVLYGRNEDGETRITRYREAECRPAEDDENPFSSVGEAELAKLSEAPPTADGFEGLVPVGWFRSRWQSDVQLCAEDLRLWNRYFNGIDQVALVLQVQPAGQPVRAGFFFRPPHGGAVRLGTSHRAFDVEEPARSTALAEDMSHLAQAVANQPAASPGLAAPLALDPREAAIELAPPTELFTLPESTGPRRGWVWAVTAAAAVFLGFVAWLVWPRALTFPPVANEANGVFTSLR